MAHDGKRSQVSHAATADEQTLRVLREAEHILDPGERGTFDIGRGLIATGGAGGHRGGEHIAEDADVGGCAVHPREEARAGVAHRIGENFVVHAFQKVERICPMFRYRLVFETVPDVLGDRTARGAIGEVC